MDVERIEGSISIFGDQDQFRKDQHYRRWLSSRQVRRRYKIKKFFTKGNIRPVSIQLAIRGRTIIFANTARILYGKAIRKLLRLSMNVQEHIYSNFVTSSKNITYVLLTHNAEVINQKGAMTLAVHAHFFCGWYKTATLGHSCSFDVFPPTIRRTRFSFTSDKSPIQWPQSEMRKHFSLNSRIFQN